MNLQYTEQIHDMVYNVVTTSVVNSPLKFLGKYISYAKDPSGHLMFMINYKNKDDAIDGHNRIVNKLPEIIDKVNSRNKEE